MTDFLIENSRHSLPTRLFHMMLAMAIVVQVITSLSMTAPLEGRHEDWLFVVHEYSGIASLLLALGFWLVVAFRRRGTQVALLYPWFSLIRRQALWKDLNDIWKDIKRLKAPEYHIENPLASAVHGLGLLLMSAMAVSGSLYFFAMRIGATGNTWASIDIELHGILASFVWIYLFGHAGLAAIHHYSRQMSLSEMWSLRK